MSAGAQAFITSDAELVDSLSGALLFAGLEQSVGRNYPDGHPVVRTLGRDTGERFAPHDLTDLVDELAVRDDTVAGEVSVAFVTGADGRRRAIVDVPGTKSSGPRPHRRRDEPVDQRTSTRRRVDHIRARRP